MATKSKKEEEKIDWEGVGLRKAGFSVPLTPYWQDEWVKCSRDPIYFIENYWKIVHPDPSKGLMLFPLRPFQKEAIQAYLDHRMIALLCSRQIGKTSVTAAFVGWFIIFHKNVNVGILADKQETAVEIHDRLKVGYENVPHWLKHGHKKWNVKSIKLENGSGVQVSATTLNAGRGRSFSIVFLDEFAAVENKIANKFMSSIIPTISSGTETKLFITSTPNGKNHFYKIVKDAEQPNSDWYLIKADYRSDPNRDNEKWVNTQKKVLGEEGFRQEHMNDFVGSTQTLLSPDQLRAFVSINSLVDTPIKIFKQPELKEEYGIFVDCAEGVGLDSSTIQVLSLAKDKMEQVACYHDNTIKPHEFALLIKQIGEMYGDANVFIEDASTGPVVAEKLSDSEYHNILSIEKIQKQDNYKIKIGRNTKGRFGGKTTEQSKLIGCTELKRLIENKCLTINDQDTINEFESFVKDGIGYAAEDGNHDDLVMALVMFGWLHSIREYRKMLQNAVLDKSEVKQKADAYAIIKLINEPKKAETFVSGGMIWEKF